MPREMKEFVSYADFNAKGVSKQTLAALCVRARNIIKIFEDALPKEKVLLENADQSQGSEAERIVKLATVRNDRKRLLNAELEKVWEDRNKKYVNDIDKTQKFENPLHIFFNIAEVDLSSEVLLEATESKEDEITSLEDKVISLTNEMDEINRVRDRYKEDLN